MIYGSDKTPSTFGSGGGGANAGSGGGTIKIAVQGTLQIDGYLQADGAEAAYQASYGGGGAGGSLYIIAGELKGGGYITANGGNGGYAQYDSRHGGGGGGGRIALYTAKNTFPVGNISVGGGSGQGNGSSGVIYSETFK